MDTFSVRDLFEWYGDTISKCASNVLNRSDEEIEHDIFEDFDVGVRSYLHDDALKRLRNEGLIDDSQVAKSKEIRSRWLTIADHVSTLAELRNLPEWLEIVKLCDDMRA